MTGPWRERDPETDAAEPEEEPDELRCERCGEVVTAFPAHSDDAICADCAGWDAVVARAEVGEPRDDQDDYYERDEDGPDEDRCPHGVSVLRSSDCEYCWNGEHPATRPEERIEL